MTDGYDGPSIDPTTEVDTALSPVEVRICPGCGKPEAQWSGGGRGFPGDDGNTYCCGGCAQQTGCTCA